MEKTIMEKKIFILRWADKQLGTGNLEEKSVWSLIKGIFGRILSSIAMSPMPLPPSLRVSLQRMRGVNIGKSVFLGMRCWLDSVRPDLITIEDYVSLAGNVTILTHSDATAPIRELLGTDTHVLSKVTIKRGAWITINVTILPGVTIGENSIIAAGSVVTKDIPPGVIAGGMPAKVLKKLTPGEINEEKAK
jgi:acetyltransferase-like isoleucine patch superfamily enzyme